MILSNSSYHHSVAEDEVRRSIESMLLITWIFVLLISCLLVPKFSQRFATILTIILVGLFIRLATLWLFPESYSTDVTGFLWSGGAILDKEPWYPSVYFPFFPYVGAVVYAVVPYVDPIFFLKAIFSLFDVGIVWLVYKLSGKKELALLYALNPLTIISTTIHGQFDTIPSFFFLLSTLMFIQNKNLFSALSLSLAIHTKTWPFLFMFPLIKRVKPKILLFIIPVLPAVMIVYHAVNFGIPPTDILFPIKAYRGVYGVWGVGFIIQMFFPTLDASLIQVLRRVSLILFLGFVLVVRAPKLLTEICLHLLFFFVVTVTFGAQWLTWLVPWVLVMKPKFWQAFMVLGTIYLAATFWSDVYSIPKEWATLRSSLVLSVGFLVYLTVLGMWKGLVSLAKVGL